MEGIKDNKVLQCSRKGTSILKYTHLVPSLQSNKCTVSECMTSIPLSLQRHSFSVTDHDIIAQSYSIEIMLADT